MAGKSSTLFALAALGGAVIVLLLRDKNEAVVGDPEHTSPEDTKPDQGALTPDKPFTPAPSKEHTFTDPDPSPPLSPDDGGLQFPPQSPDAATGQPPWSE